jgi:hypothetical protein
MGWVASDSLKDATPRVGFIQLGMDESAIHWIDVAGDSPKTSHFSVKQLKDVLFGPLYIISKSLIETGAYIPDHR